jgi:hypothetical protein
MFTSSSPSSAINTVTLVEGSFKIDPKTGSPEMELKMMYSNQETGITFGTCPFRDQALSAETRDAFDQFAKLVERDFAQLVLEGGIHGKVHGEMGDQRRAESPIGLKNKGIGGY